MNGDYTLITVESSYSLIAFVTQTTNLPFRDIGRSHGELYLIANKISRTNIETVNKLETRIVKLSKLARHEIITQR